MYGGRGEFEGHCPDRKSLKGLEAKTYYKVKDYLTFSQISNKYILLELLLISETV
jgi:hypothetical protein